MQQLEVLIKILGLEKNRFLIPNLKKVIMIYLLNSKKLLESEIKKQLTIDMLNSLDSIDVLQLKEMI